MNYQVCWTVNETTQDIVVVEDCIKCIDKNIFIPFDPDNTDYQEYLAWIAEGNEPLPADEPS